MSKTTYVDGFVLVIPKAKVEAYKKMAKDGAKLWMKYGALSYRECMIDDAKPKHIKLPFGKLVNAKPSETVWFSYIEFKSKKHRDQVNAKVMSDTSMQPESYSDMPFDMAKMSYGGFTVEVSN